MFDTTTVYQSCWESTSDIVVQQGGTWSGKTYGIMQALFSYAVSNKYVITVVGQDIPNLKRGALRDAQIIVDSSPILQSLIASYNASDRIYKFHSGTIIEFVSYDTEQNARNGKRDILFINEANGLPWNIAEQLINRTRVRSFLDYNPSAPFWAHEKLIYPRKFGNKSVQFVRSWHVHNTFLTAEQHEHIEKRSIEDPEWGRVYGRGNTGKIEGLIFRNWDVIETIPPAATRVAVGMDFGYTNDPTAIVDVRKMDNELYVDLLCYETDLTNPKIADKLKALSIVNNVVADSAEPKSIAEIRSAGVWLDPAEKGKDSIVHSIDVLKRYKIHVTSRSQPLIAELNAYKWKEDRLTGLKLQEPADRQRDHAIDAIRYVALNKLSVPNTTYSVRA
jgi:phage terminase large subunit